MLGFLKDVFDHFLKGNTFQKGASLAYYAVFSILPIIIIVISLLGIFFGKQAVSGEIYTQLGDVLGSNASRQIQDIIKNQHTHHNGTLTSIIGFATLALSASGMFSQIHAAFNSLWNIKAKPKSSILNYFRKHFVSFLLLISLFLIILLSTALNGFLIKYSADLHVDYRFHYLYEHLLSFVLLSFAFALLFKFLGDAKVYWKAALAGGLFTSLLFIFGKVAIGMYIAHSHIATTFGSASVLAVLMLWVYYTSQIVFLGASFVKIASDKMNRAIVPNKDAVRIENREIKS